MSAAMLALEDVHSYYGDSHVIQGVSLAVERGETVALVGRNGAGKTTLLKTAMAIVPACVPGMSCASVASQPTKMRNALPQKPAVAPLLPAWHSKTCR